MQGEKIDFQTKYLDSIHLQKSLKILAIKEVLGNIGTNVKRFTTVKKVVNLLYAANEVRDTFIRNNPTKEKDLEISYDFFVAALKIFIKYKTTAKINKQPKAVFDLGTSKETVMYYNAGKDVFLEFKKELKLKLS